MGEAIGTERSGHTGTVWLDNPDRRNAMGPAFWEELPAAIQELDADSTVRAVVIAARGPHFCVGLDLKSLPFGDGGSRGGHDTSPAARAGYAFRQIKRLQEAISSVERCTKPVIAAVHGYCIGGGIDLISACDIRLASEDSVFSVRETKMAIVADLGSLQRLPRILAAGHVAELAFTGRDIGARRALDIGLVNEVLATREETLETARALAEEIASNSPLAVQGTKAVLAASRDRSVEEGLDYVATWNAAFLISDDLSEAVAAFLDKRSPRFEGS